MVLVFLAVDNFDFTRKIVKKNFGEKLVKMLGVVKIEFLDKNLTFRIELYDVLDVPTPDCPYYVYYIGFTRFTNFSSSTWSS